MKQKKLTGGVVEIIYNNPSSADKGTNWGKETYTWEEVFEERIEANVDFSNDDIKFETNSDNLQQTIEQNYLKGDTNNYNVFWANIKATEQWKDRLKINNTNVKIQDKKDRGFIVKKQNQNIFYEFIFSNKTGKEIKRYKDINTGRFIKKPTGATENVRI